jgi:hypothetical protein
MWLKAEGFVD